MSQLTDFEQNLLVELRAVVAAQPEPARPAFPRRRLVLATAGGGLLAAAAVLGLSMSGGEQPTSNSNYTVLSNDDGSITVTTNVLWDAEGLERALAAHSVSAEVVNVPPGKKCRDWNTDQERVSQGADIMLVTRHSMSWTLRPSVFKGKTLVIQFPPGGSIDDFSFPVGVEDGPALPCELVDDQN